METRQSTTKKLECREHENGLTVEGLAIPYNSKSQPLEWGFREVIKPGAFNLNKRNIVALQQHDNKELLGSTKSGSLRLDERADGVYFELDLLESRSELYHLVKRGDLSGVSFGFTVSDELFTRSNDEDIREVRQGELYEISLVHTGAYPVNTVVAKRSLETYENFKNEGDKNMTEQTVTNENTKVGVEMMTRTVKPMQLEARAYARNEKVADGKTDVTVGDLIKASVTGEGNQEVREMLSTTNTGSILVPHTVMNNLIDLARNKSFLFNNATTVGMGNSQTVSIPKVASAPAVAFKKPGEEITTSDATFEEVKLEAKYMYGLVEVPLELIKTGLGVEAKLNDLLAKAMNEALEKAALEGAVDGFTGIYNDPDLVKEEITAVTYNEIKKGVKAIAANNGNPADIVLSTNNQIDLQDTTSQTGEFITPPKYYSNMNEIATNAMTDDKILLGDLSSVYVGMLQNASIEVSTQHGFSRGTLAIRIMFYGDVVVSEPKHLALLSVGA